MNKMQFVVGSASQAKISTVETVVATFVKEPFAVFGKNVASGAPAAPWDIQAKQGATNRAQALAAEDMYAIGLESGLAERYGAVYEECWSCIIYKSKK